MDTRLVPHACVHILELKETETNSFCSKRIQNKNSSQEQNGLNKMLCFGIVFVLYFFELSKKSGFCSFQMVNKQSTDREVLLSSFPLKLREKQFSLKLF